jgi:predicted SAM-dependent methyltransferase
MKLHIGCGNNYKEGYVNVDKYVKNANVKNWDILKLPIDENCVDEVLAEHLAEHLTFQEEKEFFYEMYRVLKTGGKLKLEVPDIEWVLRAFLEAKDDFKDFYQVGAIDHYFSNGLAIDNRWSLLTTAIWGNQNGEGQFHKNGYTVDKLKSIAQILKFEKFASVTDFKKGTQVIIAIFTK